MTEKEEVTEKAPKKEEEEKQKDGREEEVEKQTLNQLTFKMEN